MLADFHVMSYLNQIIQFDSLVHKGSSHRGAVYTGIGTDFYIVFYDDDTDLGNFSYPSGAGANPNPSAPTTAPACRIQLLPILQS